MSPEQRMRIGAGRLGIPFEEYRRHVEAGEKWCAGHGRWHPRDAFGTRASSFDGLDNCCRELVNVRSREYQRWLRDRNRPAYNAAQARQKREQRARARRAKLRRAS